MNYNAMDDGHFVISYELLLLLEWLAAHHQDELKHLVQHALNNGLHEHIMRLSSQKRQKASAHTSAETENDAKQHVLDYFMLLESFLFDSLQTKEKQDHYARLFLPALDHIDSSQMDPESMAASIEKAEKAIKKNTGENPKEVLCRELLKRWKPASKKAFFN